MLEATMKARHPHEQWTASRIKDVKARISRYGRLSRQAEQEVRIKSEAQLAEFERAAQRLREAQAATAEDRMQALAAENRIARRHLPCRCRTSCRQTGRVNTGGHRKPCRRNVQYAAW
jgi:hypothetical protein